MNAKIYTDGSCHTQLKTGSWVAIIFIDDEKNILAGIETDTTHNRMELAAVINAIGFIINNYKTINAITIFSDSQYVIGIPARSEKLNDKNFITKKGNEINNADLIKQLTKLLLLIPVEFVKIKAHQKKTTENNYNIEADKLSRKLVRETVKENFI